MIVTGSPDDHGDIPDPVGVAPGTGISFTEEGFLSGAPGSFRLGGEIVSVEACAFVFFSDLNVWTGTAGDDRQLAVAAQTLDGRDGDDVLTG